MIEVCDLIWRAGIGGSSAPAFGREYIAVIDEGDVWAAYAPCDEPPEDEPSLGRHKTQAEARAACQADFSRRVLACVTVSEADIRADERERLAKLAEAYVWSRPESASQMRGLVAQWLRSQTPPAGGGTASPHTDLLDAARAVLRYLDGETGDADAPQWLADAVAKLTPPAGGG